MNYNTIGIVQARISSKRLPRKIALDIYGQCLLERVINQVKKSEYINSIVVATSTDITDDLTQLICDRLNIECFRGDLNDVKSRFIEVGKQKKADIIVRITADNPLTEPVYIDQLIKFIQENSDVDYCTMNPNKIGYGTGAEVFIFKTFLESTKIDDSDFAKEHVTPSLIKNYKNYILEPEQEYRLNHFCRLTVDTFEDYLKINKIFAKYSEEDKILALFIRDQNRLNVENETSKPNMEY